MALAAMFLGLALVLPLLTGQIPKIGNMLCPMHLPVLLCGFFCGPFYALGVGLLAPLFRFFLFGAPTLVPKGIAMCFELAAYGFTAGLLYRLLPKKKIYIYVSLVAAMIAGRIIWGIARALFYGLGEYEFSFALFITNGFINAIPGIILQIALIPVLVMLLEKYTAK